MTSTFLDCCLASLPAVFALPKSAANFAFSSRRSWAAMRARWTGDARAHFCPNFLARRASPAKTFTPEAQHVIFWRQSYLKKKRRKPVSLSFLWAGLSFFRASLAAAASCSRYENILSFWIQNLLLGRRFRRGCSRGLFGSCGGQYCHFPKMRSQRKHRSGRQCRAAVRLWVSTFNLKCREKKKDHRSQALPVCFQQGSPEWPGLGPGPADRCGDRS